MIKSTKPQRTRSSNRDVSGADKWENEDRDESQALLREDMPSQPSALLAKALETPDVCIHARPQRMHARAHTKLFLFFFYRQ